MNVTNETLNETLMKVNETAVAAPSFIALVFVRLWELIIAPLRETEMLWIIFPLIFTLLVMEFYYARHRDEELGWGAAIANSMVLIFVAIDLIKTAYNYATPWAVAKNVVLAIFGEGSLAIPVQVFILISFIFLLGLGLTIINYFHLMPRQVAYVVSGHPPVNFLAYFAIIIVYSAKTEHAIPFDMATLVAGAILFILILVIVFSVRKLFTRKQKQSF
jgi:hypothetical protein